jgi:phosphate transport system ATP-binding protein
MYVDTSRGGRTGYLVEYSETKALFENPQQEYTKQYIRGEFS